MKLEIVELKKEIELCESVRLGPIMQEPTKPDLETETAYGERTLREIGQKGLVSSYFRYLLGVYY